MASTLPSGAGTGVDGLQPLRRENFDLLFSHLDEITDFSGKTLLEVGCSVGFFLEAARKRNLFITGIEPEKDKADIARGKGFPIIDGFFPESLMPDTTFDIIIFNDVFEHLPEPKAALEACAAHLTPSGLLVLNLPDSGGILYRTAHLLANAGVSGPLERLWQKGLPSPHLSYFNSHNLQQFVEREGNFQLVRTAHLKTVTLKGLKDRIRSHYAEPQASLMYAALVPLVFLQSVLPSDITVQFYQHRTA